MERFDIDKTIKILGLDIRAEQADEGRDFDVACRIAVEKMKKCKAYEDAEEQGLLLRLPCKVGDTVYTIPVRGKKEIIIKQIQNVEYRGVGYAEGQRFFINVSATAYVESDIGKYIFFTREEAEQALAEMKVE